MRTTGERVRQARLYRKLTGEQLAQRAGYKNQSAIGNLENRATGRGGLRLTKIAQALGFPLDWFLNGPDYDDLSVLEQQLREKGVPVGAATSHADRLASLLDQLNEEGAARAVEYLELLQYKFRRSDDPDADEAALAGATVAAPKAPAAGRKRA